MNNYEKEFDWWSIVKKYIEFGGVAKKFCKEREVWWCSFGVNIGVEVDGKNNHFERPALIVKKFNNQMIWVIPETTSGKNNPFHYKCIKGGRKYVLSQIRTIDSRRLLRNVGLVSEEDFARIKNSIKGFL